MNQAQPQTPAGRRARWDGLKEQADARLRAEARRPMASRRVRLTLVACYALVGGAGLAAPWILDSLWTEAAGGGGLFLLAVVTVALNQSTRNVATVRDEALDDLLLRLRDRFGRHAYLYLSAVAIPIGLLAYLPDVDHRWVVCGGWLLITLSAGLPTVFAALAFPDPDEA
jgi:hypothetical protein